jgi:hypothetical protein
MRHHGHGEVITRASPTGGGWRGARFKPVPALPVVGRRRKDRRLVYAEGCFQVHCYRSPCSSWRRADCNVGRFLGRHGNPGCLMYSSGEAPGPPLLIGPFKACLKWFPMFAPRRCGRRSARPSNRACGVWPNNRQTTNTLSTN